MKEAKGEFDRTSLASWLEVRFCDRASLSSSLVSLGRWSWQSAWPYRGRLWQGFLNECVQPSCSLVYGTAVRQRVRISEFFCNALQCSKHRTAGESRNAVIAGGQAVPNGVFGRWRFCGMCNGYGHRPGLGHECKSAQLWPKGRNPAQGSRRFGAP